MSETPPVSPDAARPAGPKRPSRGCLIACGIIAVVMTYLFMGPCSFSAITAGAFDIGRIQNMMMALDRYAEEHDERLPPTLYTLIPRYVSEEDFAKFRYSDVNKGGRSDWLYFPKAKLAGLPAHTILLAAPGTFPGGAGKQRRLVSGPGHLHDQIPEADFQRLIREQNPPAGPSSPDR